MKQYINICMYMGFLFLDSLGLDLFIISGIGIFEVDHFGNFRGWIFFILMIDFLEFDIL